MTKRKPLALERMLGDLFSPAKPTKRKPTGKKRAPAKPRAPLPPREDGTLHFPRNRAELAAAPYFWGWDTGGEGAFIKTEWLPPDWGGYTAVYGTTREMLSELRRELWDYLRDPATGEPVSKSSKPW